MISKGIIYKVVYIYNSVVYTIIKLILKYNFIDN